MTYNVFGGSLNLAQSIFLFLCSLSVSPVDPAWLLLSIRQRQLHFVFNWSK